MKEQVKLYGGLSDGEIIEVYQGAQFVDVPHERGSGKDLSITVETYRRTTEHAGEIPIYIPKHISTSDRFPQTVWDFLAKT